MKTSPSNLLLLVISLLSIFFMCHATLDEACKILDSKAAIPTDECETSLQVVPGSRSADNVELAAIAAQLALANDTSTLARITGLLKDDVKDREALNKCMELYKQSSAKLSLSIEAIKSGRYHDASAHLYDALDASSCEDLLPPSEGGSLLSRENGYHHDLTMMALVLTDLAVKG